ncbi:MAG TPA: DNA repair protein RadC, partial [Chitinophagaceae bacterium]
PSSLSDSELIAILINHGTTEKNALDLAKDVLSLGKNDLNTLGRLTVKEIMNIRGMGLAKAINIVAALELGRRRHIASTLSKEMVRNSKDVAFYLQSLLQDYSHEVFGVLLLNQAHKINHFSILSHGGITATVADPRIIIKKALEEDAVSIILCHNHPSGSLIPSQSDIDLTLKIREAAKFFDIKVLDHIIVSNEGYYSFADEGDI